MTAQRREAQDRSAELFARAVELMPGGVNSPVRAFRGVGGRPRFIRLARGATGRTKLVKFEGCYHGHGDSLLVKAGSGVATLGLPDSPGVPAAVAENTITTPFNDAAAIEAVFSEHGADIAAVIIEPVVGNMGCVPPREGFLKALRNVTERHGAILIFDEVMTGFRLARGGAQELYGVTPDLTTLGKIIGGGLPVGAYGGRRDIMNNIAPAGSVYQAGTLSGNPLAMTAGLTTLRRLRDRAVYERLEEAGRRLCEGLSDAAREAGVATVTTRVGSMFTTFFNDAPVTDWPSAARPDRAAYGRFFHAMLEEGVYLAPSQFEAAFIGAAHTDELLDRTAEAARRAFRTL